MEEQTKDHLIEALEEHNHILEEKVTFLERHVFYLEHDLRILKSKKE